MEDTHKPRKSSRLQSISQWREEQIAPPAPRQRKGSFGTGVATGSSTSGPTTHLGQLVSTPPRPKTPTRAAPPPATTADKDASVSFLFRPHTVTLMLCVLGYFVHEALYNTTEDADVLANTKTGLSAVLVIFLIIGLLMFQNGPFVRPHPAVWRIVLAIGVAYGCFLVFLLFQSVGSARSLMALYDAALGVPLPEKNYAIDCTPSWAGLCSKLDIFVVAHAFGWYAKALILRDYWITWIISVMFEVAEYSLEHQLPNFAECWWDHWLMDVLLCNGLGIYLGIKTCQYFEMKTYSWNGISAIPSYRGKVKRSIQQFTPEAWTSFRWAGTSSFKNYLISLLIIASFLQCELNLFYLKYILWIPPNHALVIMRVIIVGLVAIPAVREIYEYFYNPRCHRLGAFAWIAVVFTWTETLICIKFCRGQFTTPAPSSVVYFWLVLLTLLIAYPVYRFWLCPRRAS